MSGPIARMLAQAVVMGINLMGRAFVQAYQQAAQNPNAGKTAANAAQKALRKGISKDEALKILNLEDLPKTAQELNERYTKYFNANDPKKGGSFYLQSKFFRAKEQIEKEMQEIDKDKTQ